MIDQIIAYENGELTDQEVVELFRELIETGTIWHLQGSYQRAAQYLLDVNAFAKE